MDTIEFSQLLASRICHDLISPVAAVNNGIELLLEDTHSNTSLNKQALELIEESAKAAAVKLKLMRAAFGAGQNLPEFTSKNELLELCQPVAAKNKIDILWDNIENTQFNRIQTRLILNLFLILFEALPRGGTIEFFANNTTIECILNSSKLIFSDDKIAYLRKEKTIPVEPRYVGFVIIHKLAEGSTFKINKEDNSMTLAINQSSPVID